MPTLVELDILFLFFLLLVILVGRVQFVSTQVLQYRTHIFPNWMRLLLKTYTRGSYCWRLMSKNLWNFPHVNLNLAIYFRINQPPTLTRCCGFLSRSYVLTQKFSDSFLALVLFLVRYYFIWRHNLGPHEIFPEKTQISSLTIRPKRIDVMSWNSSVILKKNVILWSLKSVTSRYR